MRPYIAPILVVVALAAFPSGAVAATFAAPVDPATIEPGCDYGDTECLDGSRRHAGVDYLPSGSSEPIMASADGFVRIVAAAGSDASHDFGNVVVLEHTLPEGGRVSTVYAHLRERPDLQAGDCVRRGARLGTMGDTGAATNVHLHFEVKARPTLGPPYGYTTGDPDDYGFFDPKQFVGRREASDVCTTAGPTPGPTPGPAPVDPDPAPEAASDCDRGAPRAAFAGIATGASETRAAGRIRRLPARCRVQLSLVRLTGERCAYWRQSRRRMEHRGCASPLWTSAGSVAREGELARWSHRFRARLVRGNYELRVRLVDARNRVHLPGGRVVAAFSRR